MEINTKSSQNANGMYNGQFPLLDAPAGNHGSCIQQKHIEDLATLNTTTMILCRRVSYGESGIIRIEQFCLRKLEM